MARVLRTSDRKPEGVDFGDTMAQLPTPPDGVALTAAQVFSIRLRVFDRKNPRVEVWSTDLAPASVIYSTYQTDFRWDIDTIGYNFRHYLARDLVFAGVTQEQGGHTYRLEYFITTKAATGLGRILITREVYVVPAFSDIPPADTGGGGNTPDFSLDVQPSTRVLNAGDGTTFTVSTVGVNGFVGTIDLIAEPAITGITVTFDSNSIPNDSSTIMRVVTDSTLTPQSYTIYVTGTSGALSHQDTCSLSVQAVSGDFSIIANPPDVTIEEGESIDVSISSTALSGFTGTIVLTAGPVINGITYTFNPPSIIAGNTSTLTIAGAVGGSLGNYTVTITGTSGALVHTTTTLLQYDASGTGSTGWTTFTATVGGAFPTRKVYVSSSTGNDGNSGLDDTHPKLTLHAAAQLIRDGFPDWLLLKSGDTFTQNLTDGVGDYWTAAGRSATERILISTYTTGNPALDTYGARAKLDCTFHNSPPYLVTCLSTWNQQSNGHYVGNFALVNIEMTSSSYTGLTDMQGCHFYGGGADILVEGCYFHGMVAGLIFGSDGHGGAGRLSRVNVRRNIITDNYSSPGGSSGSQGIFMSDTDGALLEDNCIDCNGWSEFTGLGNPSQFKRNVYIQNGCTGVVFRNNIIGRSDGIQLRPGGDILGCFFYKNGISLQLGSGNEPEVDGVHGLVKGNVVLDGNNYEAGTGGRGWGIISGNVVGSALNPSVFSYNIVANNVSGSFPQGWLFNFDNGHGNPNGTHHCTMDHNIIWNWGQDLTASQVGFYRRFPEQPDGYPIEDVTMTNNDLQLTVADSFGNQEHLITYVTTTIDVPPEITSGGNRCHLLNVGGNSPRIFEVGGQKYNFPDYSLLVGDATSRYVEITVGNGADQYPNPNRSLATYSAGIGGLGTVADFFAHARLNSKAAWDDAYTAGPACAHVQAGFGMVVP